MSRAYVYGVWEFKLSSIKSYFRVKIISHVKEANIG